jgi:hypothetical protein
VAATRQDTLIHNVLTFALLSTAQTDSFIATYDSKAFLAFWRPVTAINSTIATPRPRRLATRHSAW